MGSKRPDNIAMEHWRGGCETVQQMREQGWEIVSQCPKCQLKMLVRLDWITRISGPQTSLWNRRPPCRRMFCSGQVQFLARPPGCLTHRPLEAPWPASRGDPGKTGFQGPRR
jgi:hypothetical protein